MFFLHSERYNERIGVIRSPYHPIHKRDNLFLVILNGLCAWRGVQEIEAIWGLIFVICDNANLSHL